MKIAQMCMVVFAFAILTTWLVTGYHVVNDPTALRKANLEQRLTQTSESPSELPVRKQAPYGEYYDKIVARPVLWAPLIAPPETPPQEPDWKTILGDLKISQIIRGESGLKAKVQTNVGTSKSQWLTEGTALNGATVREITEKGIVFSINQNGREFMHTVLR